MHGTRVHTDPQGQVSHVNHPRHAAVRPPHAAAQHGWRNELYRDPATRLVTIQPHPQNRWGRSTGGIWVPDRNRTSGRPTAVDLFCGIGGFSLGVIQAGFEVVCAVENDIPAAMTYLRNLGQWPMRVHFTTLEEKQRFNKELERTAARYEKAQRRAGKPVVDLGFSVCGDARPPGRTPVRSFIFGDIRDVTGEMIRLVAGVDEVDAVIGGPPCQGFSRANRNAGPDDPRNRLVFEFARLIVELRPNTFAMENVPRLAAMRTPDGIKVLDQFEAIIRKGGYDAYNALEKLRVSHPKATVVHHRADPHNIRRTEPAGDKKKPKKRRRAATPLLDAGGT